MHGEHSNERLPIRGDLPMSLRHFPSLYPGHCLIENILSCEDDFTELIVFWANKRLKSCSPFLTVPS